MSATISGMHMRKASSQSGMSPLALPLGISVVFLLAAVIFGGWAFMQMLDYKNNSDQKVQAAVAQAKQQEDKAKDAAFAEAQKQPLTVYKGPATYGSVTISYPKIWSAYIADTRTGSPFVDGYFYPGVVPDVQAQSSSYALRVEVVQNSYSDELRNFSSFVQQGKTKVSPFKAPKVPSVVGARVDGQLSGLKSGSMVLIPLRNMTLELWTEAPQFQDDFNNYILPNFTFAP